MTRRIRDWLPCTAATAPRVRDALEEAVDGWSGKWFAGGRAMLASIEPRAAGAADLAGGWLLYGDGAAVPADAPEAIRLAGLALGAEPESLILSEPDRDIVRRLGGTILADLAASLLAALGRDPPVAEPAPAGNTDPLAGDAGVVLRIGDARGRALTQAAITLGALVPFVKTRIPPGPPAVLQRLDRAIERISTELNVRLGETRLSLGEFAGLGPGDVLVLDGTIAAGAEITLAAGVPFARAAIEPADGVTRLLLSPATGDA